MERLSAVEFERDRVSDSGNVSEAVALKDSEAEGVWGTSRDSEIEAEAEGETDLVVFRLDEAEALWDCVVVEEGEAVSARLSDSVTFCEAVALVLFD